MITITPSNGTAAISINTAGGNGGAGASSADLVSYDGTSVGVPAVNVQEALDYVAPLAEQGAEALVDVAAHTARTDNPHQTNLATLGTGTLTDLDAVVTDVDMRALLGTNGTPGDTNRFVTNTDSRLSNARTPTSHAASHLPGGSDALTTAAPVAVGRANSEGNATSFARSNHVHDAGVVGIRTVSSSTTVANTDEILLVDTTSGAINLTLPTPSLRFWTVKKTNAGTNGITLVRAGSEQIEGSAASLLLPNSNTANRFAWTIVGDGTNWWVI